MTQNPKGKQKPFLIILEGAHASGKGTASRVLRDGVTQTNLISVAGLDRSCSKEVVAQTRLLELELALICRDSKLNFVYDRCILSDCVFQILGKKTYTFEEFKPYYLDFAKLLKRLKNHYNIKFVLLDTTLDEYERRHKARAYKPQYDNLAFDPSSSVVQGTVYRELFKDLSEMTGIPFYDIDTSAPKEEVAKKLLDLTR